MSAKKCCCCGLLSCFPCFAPITNPSRPVATHTVVESSHQLSSSAPPSAVAASQVKASRDRTVMQNAPSVPVPPSCSQGTHVASSAPVAQAASSSSRLPKESDHAKSVMESAKTVQTVMEAAQTITPIANPSLSANHMVVQSSHQLFFYAPPSAVVSSQVNASTDGTVIQNAPSVPVLPSCSQGTVTSSAPSVPVPPSLRTAPSVPVPPSCSQGTVTSFDPSVPVLPHVTSSAPPSQPASSSTSSSSSSSRLPGESDHAKTVIESAKAVDKENVDGDLSDLINYISELFRFIEEKEQGNNPSMPKTATDYWSGSKTLLKLRKVLSEGINVFKDDCPDAKTIAQDFLRGMGSAHMATTGLLAVANILERYEQISDNKKACLSLLKEMSKLAGHVKELQKLHALKKGMEASMRETIVLIVEASMACCTQIDSTKFSGFFSTIVDGVVLAEFQKQLTETYTLMQRETETLMQREYINQINMRRQKRGQLLYPQYPEDSVGIEDSLKEVIERLEMGSNKNADKNAVAVILHGFGGMGKTTLADAVFARLLNARIEGYKYSYVRLFDDITSVPDVVKLQRCILTDLMMREESEIPEIRRYEEGQRVIEQMLEKEAAFIYIDNVLLPDRVEQGRDALRQLLPRNMGKARKLRLLLTARDKDAVRISGVKPEFYPIKSLPQEEALDLFKKTLDDDSEKQLDRSQLNQVVKICGGVPNLLKVVAGFISSEGNAQQAYNTVLAENKINWKGEIGKDMECYMFAYENLEETLKDIFLDLCFFFQGWDWEALSNIVGEAELKMLEKRALLTKLVKSMTVRVHDVILAIGLDKKGERFRFTRASEFQKFLDLKEDKDLEKIKGIWSSDDSHSLDIPASKLDLMHRSLRVVILGNSTKVEGKCKEIFEELVIFRARIFDLPFDAPKLKEFKKLSHLCCKSEDLENLSEMPSKIRHIDFELKSTAFQISSSCIQQLSNLRVLRLRDAQLKILPQELGKLGNDLQELVVSNCEYLEDLPASISTLGSLKVLRIDCCSGLTRLPPDFGSLSSLQELHLRECGSLEVLPSSLGNLASLQELHLNWCVSLEALPDSVEKLSSLRLLDLSSCESITNLPHGLEKLPSLVELSLRFCWELNYIPKSIGQFKLLDSLDLSHTKVNELPDEFCNLSFITKLEMNGCRYLEKLPDRFGEVTSLRKLSLVDCNSLKELPKSFNHLNYLEHLNLSKCETLEELCIYFKGLSSLRVLSLGDCKMLKNLPQDFHCLASLEVLDVRNCYKLEGKGIDSMLKMKTLEIVNITGSTLLEGRWGEIPRQGDHSTLTVYTGQDRTENSERKTTTCGVDKLKGKTILVEMWPYNSWRWEINYHQFWKEVYFMEKEKVDLEIISIPIVYPSKECDVIDVYKQFSREVPWLVLQNSWTVITRAVKLFFEKHGGWEERDEICEKWYPTINWIIEPKGRISVYRPSIFLKEEWEQPKNMSTLEFLFNHLESVSPQVKKLMLPGKLICLYRGGDDDEQVLYSIWNALDQQQRDRIHIIHLGRREKESSYFTNNIGKDYYYPLKNTAEIEGMSSLNLSENEILRFSLRLCHLEKEINRMEDSELKFLLHSFQPLHSFENEYGMDGSIAFMDGGGKVVAALGGKILESIFDRKDRAERFIKLIMSDIEGGGGGGKEMHDEDPGVSLQTSSAAAVEQQNMDAYFDSLREYTSERWGVEVYQAFRFNKEGEKLSLPKVTWPTSKGFCRLKNFLSEGINGDWVKDVIFRHPEEKSERTIVIHSLLKGIEEALWAVAGLLVVADLLDRLETISANRSDHLVVLEKMFRVAQYIQQFNQKPGLSWRRVKRVATAIILACSLGCCCQIDESKFALFGKENLTNTERVLTRICDMMAEAITEGLSNESGTRLEKTCYYSYDFRFFRFFLEGGPSCEGESGVEGGSTAGTSGQEE